VFPKEWRNVGFAIKGIHDEKKHSRTILCLDEFASSCRLRKSDASLVGSIFFYGDFVVCLFGSGNIVSFFYLSLL